MAKKKEKKKKDRERRVAQEKHAADQKRSQEKTAKGASQGPKTNIFTSAVPEPKINPLTTSTKKTFNYRRSGG
jgi:hypothetical protein